MEILNLKVIDKHRLAKFFNHRTKHNGSRPVEIENLVADNKVTCGIQTLSNYIKRVVSGGINIALICMEVQYILSLLG